VPTLQLTVNPADGSPFQHRLEGDTLIIGRSSTCDLTLPDRSLSRRHARLFRDGAQWFVEDLGSRNGTVVNGAQVKVAAPLNEGAVLVVGSSSLTLGFDRGILGRASHTEPSSSHTLYRSAAEILEDSSPVLPATDVPVNDPLRTYADRLRILNEVHQALDHSVESEDLLAMILDRAFDHLKPEDGAVFLRDTDGELRCAVRRPVGSGDDATLYSTSLVREVVDGAQAAIVLDAATDSRFNQAMSIMSSGMRSLVAAPLLEPTGAMGMIVLGSSLHRHQFTEEDMELLVSLASVAAMRLRNIRLTFEAADRERLEQEVSLARHIQVALLPDALPELDGYLLHAGNIPSRGVSGDFYKVLERREQTECAIMIADVSGKGVAASLLTASLEALSAGPIEQGHEPDEICGPVSRLLFQRTPPEKYATAFLAALEIDSGRLRYCNAGHNPGLLIRRSGETEWLASTGMPLGLLPTATYTTGEVFMEPEDTVVIYTDGITEAENPDEEEYGEERLEAVCARQRREQPQKLASAIEEDLDRFVQGVPFADDRTLVVIRRLSPQP